MRLRLTPADVAIAMNALTERPRLATPIGRGPHVTVPEDWRTRWDAGERVAGVSGYHPIAINGEGEVVDVAADDVECIDSEGKRARVPPDVLQRLDAAVADVRERVSETPAEPRLGVGNGNGRP